MQFLKRRGTVREFLPQHAQALYVHALVFRVWSGVFAGVRCPEELDCLKDGASFRIKLLRSHSLQSFGVATRAGRLHRVHGSKCCSGAGTGQMLWAERGRVFGLAGRILASLRS